jgi:hypothetical protein
MGLSSLASSSSSSSPSLAYRSEKKRSTEGGGGEGNLLVGVLTAPHSSERSDGDLSTHHDIAREHAPSVRVRRQDDKGEMTGDLVTVDPDLMTEFSPMMAWVTEQPASTVTSDEMRRVSRPGPYH